MEAFASPTDYLRHVVDAAIQRKDAGFLEQLQDLINNKLPLAQGASGNSYGLIKSFYIAHFLPPKGHNLHNMMQVKENCSACSMMVVNSFNYLNSVYAKS